VRRLVAGAVPNLKPEDVRVIWTTATRREIPNIKPPTSKNPEPTVLALSGVVALLLLTLIGVTLQLVKANRQLNRGGNRLATNLSR
jgi:type III secretory pathway lipoprotein EscJ